LGAHTKSKGCEKESLFVRRLGENQQGSKRKALLKQEIKEEGERDPEAPEKDLGQRKALSYDLNKSCGQRGKRHFRR